VANIYDVAKRAGVSTATVSRVLSQPSVVAPATRRRVLQAVERLEFPPNSTAKNLRTHKTGKLLVTVPDISNPFFSQILQGIEGAAQREGYSVLLGDTQHEEKREEAYAMMLRRKEADGLIFLGHRLPKPRRLDSRWRPGARRWSTGASSVRVWASRACTSTMRAPHTKRWTICTAWAIAASASSLARW
jgi:DNA-binding LacI/PurR family transcriptional regulator